MPMGEDSIVPRWFAITDERGAYTITEIPAGLATVFASADGYQPEHVELEIISDATVEQNFELALLPPPVEPGTLIGHVLETVSDDETIPPRPIAGARVDVAPSVPTITGGFAPIFAITDENGAYAIPGIPSGPAKVFASAAGHLSASAEVEIIAGATVEQNFMLRPTVPGTASLVGVVVEDTGMLDIFIPIPDALVIVTDAAGLVQDTRTNEGGMFEFKEITAGMFTVSAEAAGYITQSMTDTVPVGEQAHVMLRLPKEPSTGSSISGTVFMPSPAGDLVPAGGVPITLHGSPNVGLGPDIFRETASDRSGHYHFGELPAGYTYALRATAYDMVAEATVPMAVPEHKSVDLYLQRL
jgi:hypothetical protein